MSDTLYLKIDQNVRVENPTVLLKDIASLTCTNEHITNKLKTLKIFTFEEAGKGNGKEPAVEVFSILKIIQLIGKEYPNLQIQNEGKQEFVLEYVAKKEAKWMSIGKVTAISILVFFGSAFTIMTFNNDAGVADVFRKFYQQVMGKGSNGFTILEVSYSLGLALGILIFFNHVGRKKVTIDPTPMQVQMRKYEEDVDTTFIENSSRKGSNIDVD